MARNGNSKEVQVAKRVSQADGAAAVAMLDRERKAPAELAEVWCANDESNAVAMVGDEAVCATCFPVAYAKAVAATRAFPASRGAVAGSKFMEFQPLPADFNEEVPS